MLNYDPEAIFIFTIKSKSGDNLLIKLWAVAIRCILLNVGIFLNTF